MSDKLKIEADQADFERIEKVMAEATAKFIEELPSLIHKRLEGAVARILGFSDSWGKWEVDHCNGRMSVMSDYIGTKAKEAARAAVDSIQFKTNSDLQKAISTEYAEQFKMAMRDRIRHHAEEQVKLVLDKAAATASIEIETLSRVPTKKELANPSYGKKPLEKLIMETIVASKADMKEGEE